MRSLGTIPVPAFQAGYTFKDIQSKCQDYAQQKALEDFKTSGEISDFTTLQVDIDVCTANMDSGRQIRQGLILVTGLIVAGFLGHFLWQSRA